MKRVSPKRHRLSKKENRWGCIRTATITDFHNGAYIIRGSTGETITLGSGFVAGDSITFTYGYTDQPNKFPKKVHVARRRKEKRRAIAKTAQPLYTIDDVTNNTLTITESATIKKTLYNEWKVYARNIS